MVSVSVSGSKCSYDEALDRTGWWIQKLGFGKYHLWMLISCSHLILAMYLDIFGASVVLPAIACELELSTTQQGLISAAPLIGVMLSSYFWGLCADTKGRRWTLLVAMPIGAVYNLATAFAPNYPSLVALKFLSGCFTSAANAAAFVLVGETYPQRHRSRAMFIMASVTMFVQLVASVCTLLIFLSNFRLPIPGTDVDFRPWRLVLLLLSLPGVIGTIIMAILCESPKYLLSKGRTEDGMKVLRRIFLWNSGSKEKSYPVQKVLLEESLSPQRVSPSVFSKVADQTTPLFKPPLLMNSLKLYFILLCAYMTSTGFTMWVPTMTNAYFSGGDTSGKTFCQVASTAATSSGSTSKDCDNVINNSTLYAVMCYSAGGGLLTIVLSCLVGFTGKRNMTLLVFGMSITAGVLLLFITVPMLSIALFCIFLYVALILGNINTYLVELNPTHLRGMATCLSVVVARGFGFMSVQLIAALLADYCVIMISGYIGLVVAGLVVSFFLPPEELKLKESPGTTESIVDNYEKTKF